VFVQLDATLARTEPDPEIQALIKASAGLNLALDYLPGSVTFDPLAEKPDGELASSIVWFDAFVTNVDRTPRNTNLLVWHRTLWLIDHGAALYFHHDWENFLDRATQPFAMIKNHVLLPFADRIAEVDATLSERLTIPIMQNIVARIPDSWLGDGPFATAGAHRQAYLDYLVRRVAAPRAFVEEAIRARSNIL
jgi:hypothetical protein